MNSRPTPQPGPASRVVGAVSPWIFVVLLTDAGVPAPPSEPAVDPDAEVIEQMEFLETLELLRDDDRALFLDEDDEDVKGGEEAEKPR